MSDGDKHEKDRALANALAALTSSTTSNANAAIGAKALGIGGGALGVLTLGGNPLGVSPVYAFDYDPNRLIFPHHASQNWQPGGLLGPTLVSSDSLLAGFQALRDQHNEATKKVEESRAALKKAATTETTETEQKAAIALLEADVKKLQAVNRLEFLMSRVCPSAQEQLMKSERFQKQFLEPTPSNAFVMSVDIRRSTELMLKAKSPEHFCEFITTLCAALMETVKGSYGVLDKFTGDGILAFYPDFYSGADAGYSAVAAADKCHDTFNDHYKQSRTSFTSVLLDVGLGIGIDYGVVHLIQMAGGLTVMGKPVVYACRLSAAPAGRTYINQPAYEEISKKFSQYCLTTESMLDIKHEGPTLAYTTHLTKHPYAIKPPTWPSD